jgi:hypothetical protein
MPKTPEPTEVVFGPRTRAGSFVVAAVLVAAGAGIAVPVAMSARRAPRPSAASGLPATPSLTPLPSLSSSPSPRPEPTESVAPVARLNQRTNSHILLADGRRLIQVDVDARTTRTAFSAPAGLQIGDATALEEAVVVTASDFWMRIPRIRTGIYLLPRMADGSLGPARTLVAPQNGQEAWAFASQTQGRIWIARVSVELDECFAAKGLAHLYEVDLQGNVTTPDRRFDTHRVNPSVSVPGGFLSHEDDRTCNGTSVVHRLDSSLRIVQTILAHNVPCEAGQFEAETRRSLLISDACWHEDGGTKLSVLDFLTGKTQRFTFSDAWDLRLVGSDPAGRTLAIALSLPSKADEFTKRDFESGYLQIVRGGHTERVVGSEARWYPTEDHSVAYQSRATVTPSGRWVFYVNPFYELRAYSQGTSYSVPIKLPRGFRPSILTAIDG